MTEKISQSKQILEYLQAGNTITPLEALNKFGCLRLGARIYDLIQRGHQINSVWVSDNGKRYKRYGLVGYSQLEVE